MRRTDILLAIVAAADGEKITGAHLQKVAFLVSRQFDDKLPEDFYKFDKYDYGPFAVEVYREAELLEYWQLIEIHRDENNRKTFCTTLHDSFDNIELPASLKAYIKEALEWARKQSFAQLITSIYFMFPEYMENSVFERYSQEQVVVDTFTRSLRSLKEGKVYPAREKINELRHRQEIW